MEGISKIISAHLFHFMSEETEAGNSCTGSLSSESRAHRQIPSCPCDTICPAFKNDIDLKSLISSTQNSCYVDEAERDDLQILISSLRREAGSPGVFCQSGKLLARYKVRTEGASYRTPNLSE